MKGNGNSPEIIPVRHHEQRHNPDGSLLQGMNPAHKMHPVRFNFIPYIIRNFDPEPLGLKFKLWQVQGDCPQRFLIGYKPSVIPCHLFSNP